jgi:hypothetical protein
MCLGLIERHPHVRDRTGVESCEEDQRKLREQARKSKAAGGGGGSEGKQEKKATVLVQQANWRVQMGGSSFPRRGGCKAHTGRRMRMTGAPILFFPGPTNPIVFGLPVCVPVNNKETRGEKACLRSTRFSIRSRAGVTPHISPPLSPSPHANSFVIGTAVINTHLGILDPSPADF